LIPIGNVGRFDQDICPGCSDPMGSIVEAMVVKIEYCNTGAVFWQDLGD
jgi:hypothetical protein